MSSMEKNDVPRYRVPFNMIALLLGSAMVPSSVVLAEGDGSQLETNQLEAKAAIWDEARASLIARQPSAMAPAIERWEELRASKDHMFEDYAGFVLAYPGFPLEEAFRERAEERLDDEVVPPDRLVAFFDANPPLTNTARARYALALAALGRDEAASVARDAWREGAMDGVTEAYVDARFASSFSTDDHLARMNALLWQEEVEAAQRMLLRLPVGDQPVLAARRALIEGVDGTVGAARLPGEAYADPGFVYNLARFYRSSGQADRAAQLLANRPQALRPARDPQAFVTESLAAAERASPSQATAIAARVEDVFEPGTDKSRLSFRLRDDYTSLMWLGGTSALWTNGDARAAAPLFYRYGAAAQTPQTRSKGFYWAGHAAERAGDMAEAARYFDLAAQYSDRFYGQLALAELGRPMPQAASLSTNALSDMDRQAFEARPLAQAVREVARGAPWRTGIQFYRELAREADTEAEHALVADYARRIGRRDLAVNMAEAAGADGLKGVILDGYPVMDVPAGTDWTIAHAITRQESQFAQNAISHADARGLMQLIPATAREQAGKLGLQYMSASLIDDPAYNVRLGSAYFARMLDYYDGAYPLAIAAYNAGPGNVNRWLRSLGDPRTGSVDWLTWIERIPFFETKNYVHRVIENAAVYEHLYPEQASYGRPRLAGDFLTASAR
jgi:soluble lytic murein transglycosylase